MRPRTYLAHDLYQSGDGDAPEAVKDRNGEVALDQCRRCGQAEGDLLRDCPGDPTQNWRDASMKLCDALDSILHEDSDKSEQARLTDRVIASELLHIVRSKLLPDQPQS